VRYKVIDNFLRADVFDELLKTYPTAFGKEVRGHGDIYETDIEWNLISKEWKEFYRSVHLQYFWEPFIAEFNIERHPFVNLFREPRQGMQVELQPPRQYGRMDISIGREGYGLVNGGKGPHIDNKNRILSALLYFTDQEEIEGGEFIFTDSKGTPKTVIPIKKNRLIISTQDKDAWHMVNPVTKGERRSVYMALSQTTNYWNR
jgi:hypothetical protein